MLAGDRPIPERRGDAPDALSDVLVRSAQPVVLRDLVAHWPMVQAARDLNPKIRIVTRSTYLKENEALLKAGADAVFSSEGEIALSMTAFLMSELGASDEQVDRERDRVREELFDAKGGPIADATVSSNPVSVVMIGGSRKDPS